METIWRRWRILFAMPLLVTLIGCGAPSVPPAPGTAAAAQTPTAVTVRELIDGSGKYDGQRIRLTGKIVVECPEGCWFFLDDGTAKIYVDLKPAGLTIPQKVGSRIELIGKTKGTGGNLQVLGDEVKFIDER